MHLTTKFTKDAQSSQRGTLLFVNFVSHFLCALCGFAFIFFLPLFSLAQAQNDSVSIKPGSDSFATEQASDTFMNTTYARVKDAHSLLLNGNKTVLADVEQYHEAPNNGFIFAMLALLIAVVAYLKAAFGNDLDDLAHAVRSRNMAQQLFRGRTKDISFSSVVLNINFVVTISLFVHFIISNYMHAGISSIVLIIFLFTFFYVAKLAVVKLAGVMFDAREECDEYIFNFTNACKIAGLTLLPALFILYTAQQKFYNLVIALVILIAGYLAVNFVTRGLSTGYKLLYRSVYHFFIYVCVVEISPIFLLFKLLTKTIT